MFVKIKDTIINTEGTSYIKLKANLRNDGGEQDVWKILFYEFGLAEARYSFEYFKYEDAKEDMRLLSNQMCDGHECCGGSLAPLNLNEKSG